MSAELLGAAFKADVRPHAYKLVMLKLVDACRDDGTKIWPAVETIAKAAGVSKRHTQRVLNAFVEVGMLRVVSQGGRGRGDTTEYALDVAMLRTLGTSHRVTFENGRGTLELKDDAMSSLENRVTSEAVKDDSGVTQPLSDPLVERDARAREDDEADIERTLGALVTAWERGAIGGRGAIGDSGKARAQIAGITRDDRQIAVDAAPRWIRSLKDAKRNYTPAIETFIKNREFEHFPRPVGVDGGTVQPMELKPYSLPLWSMFWKLVARNEERASKEGRDRIAIALRRIEIGLTTAASAVPSNEDQAALVPVTIDSPDHARWGEWATRVNLRLPRPDAVPVIYAPAGGPPELSLNWKGYPLAAEFRTAIRSKLWWWRVYRPGVSVGEMINQARRESGTLVLTFGPMPTAAELDQMVEIDRAANPDQFDHWSVWFDAHGAPLNFFPSPLWCPSEYPPNSNLATISTRQTADAT